VSVVYAKPDPVGSLKLPPYLKFRNNVLPNGNTKYKVWKRGNDPPLQQHQQIIGYARRFAKSINRGSTRWKLKKNEERVQRSLTDLESNETHESPRVQWIILTVAASIDLI
jgi:hypothetical protein